MRALPFGLAVLLSLVVLFLPASGVPSSPPGTDKVVHLLLFAVLAVTARTAGWRAAPVLAGLLGYAALSEVLQALLPLGRSGDVFRSGAHFLNYRRFGLVADELYGYAGQVQIVLDEQNDRERLTIRLERDRGLENHDVLADFLQRYPELWITAERDRMVTADVELCAPGEFVRTETSGKLGTVLDHRDRSR